MINPTWYPAQRQLRQFAVISLLGFGLLGALARFHFGAVIAPWVLWAIGLIVCLAGLAAPRAIRPVYALLMAIAFPIGWLISHLLLRVLFYCIFTPLGLILRMTGRDPLRLKRPSTDSYWLKHKQRNDPLSYYRQA